MNTAEKELYNCIDTLIQQKEYFDIDDIEEAMDACNETGVATIIACIKQWDSTLRLCPHGHRDVLLSLARAINIWSGWEDGGDIAALLMCDTFIKFASVDYSEDDVCSQLLNALADFSDPDTLPLLERYKEKIEGRKNFSPLFIDRLEEIIEYLQDQ